MEFVEIIVTGPVDWMHERIPKLLDRRLIACAHMWEIRSHYWWEGKTETATELRAALHTRKELFRAVERDIETNHPYDVACIVATDIAFVNGAYARWIIDSTVATK